MARATFSALLFVLATTACGREPAREPPDLIIASSWLTRMESPSGRVVARRFLPSAATDLDLAPGGDLLGVSLRSGAAFVSQPELDVVWSEQLGIVDAMVFHPDGDRAYLLLHPGDDPHEAAGDHTVLEVSVPSGAHLRRFELDRRSFDIAIALDGSHLLVTSVIGRTLRRIDLEKGTVEALRIESGASRAEEPELSMLRVAIPAAAAAWIIPEDVRGKLELWTLAADGCGRLPVDLEVPAPILGGARAGASVWLHARHHLLQLEDGALAAVHALARTEREGPYRWSHVSEPEMLAVLVAPAPAEHQGPPRMWIQFWDLERGSRLSRRLVEGLAGPVVQLPAPVRDETP